MIDRNRVRELAKKKSPLRELVEFLDRTELEVRQAWLLMAELESLADAAASGDRLRCIVPDRIELTADRPRWLGGKLLELRHRLFDVSAQLVRNEKIVKFRISTGRVSDQRWALFRRLEALNKQLWTFLYDSDIDKVQGMVQTAEKMMISLDGRPPGVSMDTQ
jgi:hypothetical protein